MAARFRKRAASPSCSAIMPRRRPGCPPRPRHPTGALPTAHRLAWVLGRCIHYNRSTVPHAGAGSSPRTQRRGDRETPRGSTSSAPSSSSAASIRVQSGTSHRLTHLHTRLALDKHGGTWGLDRSAWVERRQGGGFERGHGRWRTRRPRRAAGDGLRHSQSPIRAEVPPEQSSLSARFLPLGGH